MAESPKSRRGGMDAKASIMGNAKGIGVPASFGELGFRLMFVRKQRMLTDPAEWI